MNRAVKTAALGAAIGFFMMVCILVLKARSPMIVNTLWPTHFLERSVPGGFWALLVRTAGFFTNVVLYGIVGYAVGRLIYGKERVG